MGLQNVPWGATSREQGLRGSEDEMRREVGKQGRFGVGRTILRWVTLVTFFYLLRGHVGRLYKKVVVDFGGCSWKAD